MTELPVYSGFQLHHPWIRNFVCCDDSRPHRTERVERLAEEPLLVALLCCARGHVIDDGVAKYVIERLFRRNSSALFADDERQLTLVVNAVIAVERAVDFISRPDDRAGHLSEEDRHIRDILTTARRIESAAFEFRRVLVIVLSYAHDVGTRHRDGREQSDVFSRDGLNCAFRQHTASCIEKFVA